MPERVKIDNLISQCLLMWGQGSLVRINGWQRLIASAVAKFWL